MEGWIKLHRKILDWEWYKNLPTRVLFLHILLTANYEDKTWKGIEIKRGQLITSLNHLSEQTGLTKQQVRSALDNLQITHNITRKITHNYTLVTIENYGLYQSYNDFITQRTTHKPHAK